MRVDLGLGGLNRVLDNCMGAKELSSAERQSPYAKPETIATRSSAEFDVLQRRFRHPTDLLES
jgi:hypothetical protein